MSINTHSETQSGFESFIERLLYRVGEELTDRLWEQYEISNEIRYYFKKGLRIIDDEDIQKLHDEKEHLLKQIKDIIRLRERFLSILNHATEPEINRVSKQLGLKAHQLCEIGQDYEKLVNKSIA